MKYGYARVSTTSQELANQIEILKNEKCDVIFSEKISGSFNVAGKERFEFNKLLNIVKENDVIVVTKIDRLARNTKQAISIIEDLFSRKVKVHVLNMGIIEDTPQGNLIFSIISAFSQYERDMIVERTQEGKFLAKQKEGYVEGRPKKYPKVKINHAMDLLEKMSYKKVSEITGISVSTLTREKRKRKFDNKN